MLFGFDIVIAYVRDERGIFLGNSLEFTIKVGVDIMLYSSAQAQIFSNNWSEVDSFEVELAVAL